MSQRQTGGSTILPTRAVLAGALVLLLSLATAAAGQAPQTVGVQLNINVGAGTRALTVTDLLNQEIDNLNLVAETGKPYKATVNDLDYVLGEGFELYTETGHLYDVTTAVPETEVDTSAGSDRIESRYVSISRSQGVSTSGLLADVTPQYLLNLAAGLVNCTATLAALPEAIAASLTIASPEIVNVCAAIAGVNPAVSDIPVAGPIIADVDLDGLVADLLGLVDGLGVGQSEPFTNPSFLGLGTTDPAAPAAATQVTLMDTTPPALLDTITGALDTALDLVTDVTGQDVTDVVDAADVAAALSAHADATVQTLGTAVGNVGDAAAQNAILNEVLTIVAADSLLFGNLSNLVGVYSAFPVLTVSPLAGTPEGAYAGTHTVTLVSK